MNISDLHTIINTTSRQDLTEVDLRSNQLTTLPPEVLQLTNLTRLDLSDNQISALPPEIVQLTNLAQLNFSSNQIMTLPLEITQLTNLTQLDVSNNELTTLPPEIADLINLEKLNIDGNRFTHLTPELFQLINLRSLIIQRVGGFGYGNSFKQLPSEIGLLINLEELVADNCKLEHLPSEIGQLTNLKILWLWGNQLTELPEEIWKLTNLREFHPENNKLTAISSRIGQLVNLTDLNIAQNSLRELPLEIQLLGNLKRLLIYNNQLTQLPREAYQLTQLKELVAWENQINNLPPEIAQLVNLTRFEIQNNQLTTIPSEIAQLTNLTDLNLSNNQLTTLPSEIAQLTNLTDLNLSNNQLTTLPPEIAQLVNLTRLELSSNQLTTLPPEIAQLVNLTQLYLNDNQLTTLPLNIAQLDDLQIEVNNNPFSALPPEIVEQGGSAILTYLKELLQGFENKWVSKLILVGEGGVGKTSLLRALRGESFTDSSTTKGIEIHSLKLAHSFQEGVDLTLNAWDFGGQEIYHATHQFFLTNRSLFLLIWNARHGWEQGKLYYWLDAIQARAPDSPILVIAAWTDERDADLPAADLQRKYPQIEGFHQISNKTGKGIAELRQAVAQVASTRLPLMGEKWPMTWLKAADAVRECLEKHITPDELWSLMSEHDVSKAGTRVLVRWLHELGDILFYRDENDVNDLVILKPQWVTQYIGKVLESDDVIGRSGIFTDDHMQILWGDLDPFMRQHFLRLMEHFDLSYRTLEDQEVSLVVERLPLDPPDYFVLWNKNANNITEHEISMKFKLNTILPGIPTWFIARSHRFTTHTHWRMGAIFAYEAEQKHLALVQAFPHDRYIRLTVRGPSPQNFFALLKDGLEVTLARYPGLKIERTVPCPGHEDRPCDYEFNYENLQKAIEREKPIEYVQCQTAFENVSVPQLLFGLHWRTQNNVVAKIDEISFKLDQIERDNAIRHDELVTLLQREFVKAFKREQSQIETYCPNVFVLRPYASSIWKKAWLGEKLELQLYCQAPGCWHPTGDKGHYVFDYPPKWLRATGHYIQDMVNLLKFVTPLLGPWVGISAADYAKLIADDIKLMEGLVKIMPEIVETSEMKVADEIELTTKMHQGDEYIDGAGLRAVRQLLEKLDEHQVWGDLKRVLTPEGHYLWLCDYHTQEYRR
jgi:Leucine-rich repeat (LRR) protein